MRIDIDNSNPAFIMMTQNPEQVFFLDANIFIPPDRSGISKKIGTFRFEDYKDGFLEPLLCEFTNLAIHETVYNEIVADSVKEYVDSSIGSTPSKICVHYDRNLTDEEKALLQLFLNKLSIHSQYDPVADNAKDRGEVRSLSYMAVKKYLYFAANDALPIRLIKNAEELRTSLDDLGVIQPYELIYYLYKQNKYDNKVLRILYKYLYYLTARDKAENPDWGTFVERMSLLYEKQG